MSRGATLFALALPLLLLGGCAPRQASGPLAIAYDWPQGRPDGWPPAALHRQAPRFFTLRWNPADYAAPQIHRFAEQQCLAFNRHAGLLGESGGSRYRLDRFACDKPLIRLRSASTALDAHRGAS